MNQQEEKELVERTKEVKAAMKRKQDHIWAISNAKDAGLLQTPNFTGLIWRKAFCPKCNSLLEHETYNAVWGFMQYYFCSCGYEYAKRDYD